ncbi:MAG: phosphatase PAP2 family protein [Gallionella sp.]
MTHRIYSLQQIQTWDDTWCLRFNSAIVNPAIRHAFRLISRLGNGIFWYCLMLWLLLEYRAAALVPVLHMVAAGLACTILYKWLKRKTHRPRPYSRNPEINCGIAPLDQFSFPSGHTLHAVAFSVVALAYYPALAWLLLPFTALVAVSRLVLGLHYPSDVLAGIVIGAAISGLTLG